MPQFRDEHIAIIAPGTTVTLAQLGLPESFTPARLRVKSRMFPGEKVGEWEPNKVRKVERAHGASASNGISARTAEADEPVYEEDPLSDEGAAWPIQSGRITNWSCLFALITHVYNTLSPPFHTPILLITQPAWTAREHERLAQFLFEKFKPPGLALMDAAQATCYAFGVPTACIVDVGATKADITAVTDFVINEVGRGVSVEGCGGEAMTERLLELLGPKSFNRQMCEQLKMSSICEVLPPGVPLPSSRSGDNSHIDNPAAAASTGAEGSGPNQRHTAAALGEAPMGPGKDTQVGEADLQEDDNEGVLDVASIVTGGKMNEFIARKEKEKAEKAASKKKGEAAASQSKAMKLKNSERETNTFLYEDHALLNRLETPQLIGPTNDTAPEGSVEHSQIEQGAMMPDPTQANGSVPLSTTNVSARREITVGSERFEAVSDHLLARLTEEIHRTILSVPNPGRRAELWDSLVFVGNGSAVRGFKEALLATLQSRFIISPSSATIFTSELPSNISTPLGTGTSTPIPQVPGHSHGPGVNPLLIAATTASAQSQMQTPGPQYLQPGSAQTPGPSLAQQVHSSHGQTPTSMKVVKMPEYFPEWKEAGSDEAVFLGAQVAAKVIYISDQGAGGNKGYMSRSDYNEQGPTGIHDYVM